MLFRSGKETGQNELEPIAAELARFIDAIEAGDDAFFHGAPIA